MLGEKLVRNPPPKKGGFLFVKIMLEYISMFRINKKLLLFVGAVLLVVVIIVVNRLLIRPELLPLVPESNSGDKTSGNNSSENDDAIIKALPVQNYPRYSGRPINEVRFGAGFSSASEKYIEKQRKDLVLLSTILSANPMGQGGVDDWIAVGVIKKSFNDYEGARDAWEYANILYPSNGLSFANLGNLYGFYLRDNEKAELNLKKAIANDPYQPSYYIGLADFYKVVDVSKKGKVPEVILSGLDRVKDVNLYLYLASYYRGMGDKVNAVKYYQEVLKMSPDQAGIQKEIDRLKQ